MPLGNTPLPTADDFVQQHAELLQVMNDVRKRNRGGRHDKHDTARLRYIKDIALRGLRFGKMVPPVDVNMIRLPPKAELRGADLAAMDAWAKRHAPDPRSANQGVNADITEEQQSTLLRWAARHAADFVAPLDARRGRPAAYNCLRLQHGPPVRMHVDVHADRRTVLACPPGPRRYVQGYLLYGTSAGRLGGASVSRCGGSVSCVAASAASTDRSRGGGRIGGRGWARRRRAGHDGGVDGRPGAGRAHA